MSKQWTVVWSGSRPLSKSRSPAPSADFQRAAELRGGRYWPLDLAFVDRQINEPSQNAERDRQIPHDVVAAGRVVQVSAEPRTQKASDLVRKEREPREHRQKSNAENLCDDAICRRNGGEPQKSQRD